MSSLGSVSCGELPGAVRPALPWREGCLTTQQAVPRHPRNPSCPNPAPGAPLWCRRWPGLCLVQPACLHHAHFPWGCHWSQGTRDRKEWAANHPFPGEFQTPNTKQHKDKDCQFSSADLGQEKQVPEL